MSEYQYYEFQAVDKPLTRKQMSELRGYSTRAEITPTHFVNSYNFGSFKGSSKQWMERYFDAHLYFANWGTRILMLRIPERLLDEEALDEYCTETGLSFRLTTDSFVLSFTSEVEDYDLPQDEGALSSILPVRSGLMRGDHRALYLGWLLAVQPGEVDDETPEPRLPAGLGQLDASLEALSDFLRIDQDIVAAAAEGIPDGPATGPSRDEIVAWVRTLSPDDKDSFLASFIEGDDSRLAAELFQRARERKCVPADKAGLRRTAGQIRARAEIITETRKRKEAERRAREKAQGEREEAEKRLKYLQSLVGSEVDLWAKVDKLIATRQPGPYDEAVTLLQDLRDLADMTGEAFDFRSRMTELYTQHSRKPSLLGRFRKAKLV
ncbi:MAG: hypothetical protein ABSC19_00610 [Syntrophorhabdales bacterium]|jgi:tetratricopeptide (TPR) repeat protein